MYAGPPCSLRLCIDREVWAPGETLTGVVHVYVRNAPVFAAQLNETPELLLKVYGSEKGIFKGGPSGRSRRYLTHDYFKHYQDVVRVSLREGYERAIRRGAASNTTAVNTAAGTETNPAANVAATSTTTTAAPAVPVGSSCASGLEVTYSVPFVVSLPLSLPPSYACDTLVASCSLHYRIDVALRHAAMASAETTAGPRPSWAQRKAPDDPMSRLFFVSSAVRASEWAASLAAPQMLLPSEVSVRQYRSLAQRLERRVKRSIREKKWRPTAATAAAEDRGGQPEVVCEVSVRPSMLVLTEGSAGLAPPPRLHPTARRDSLLIRRSSDVNGGVCYRKLCRCEASSMIASRSGSAQKDVHTVGATVETPTSTSEAESHSDPICTPRATSGRAVAGAASSSSVMSGDRFVEAGGNSPPTMAHRRSTNGAAAVSVPPTSATLVGGGEAAMGVRRASASAVTASTTATSAAAARVIPAADGTLAPLALPANTGNGVSVRVTVHNVMREKPIVGVRVRLLQVCSAIIRKVRSKYVSTLAYVDYIFMPATSSSSPPPLTTPAIGTSAVTVGPTREGLPAGVTAVFDLSLVLPSLTRMSEDFADTAPLPTVQTQMLSNETALDIQLIERRPSPSRRESSNNNGDVVEEELYIDSDPHISRLFFSECPVHVASVIDRSSSVPALPQMFHEKIRPAKAGSSDATYKSGQTASKKASLTRLL